MVADKHQDKRDRYAALIEKFAEQLPGRVHALAEQVRDCREGRAGSHRLLSVAADVHKLAGSCGVYGYGEFSENLVGLELLLLAVTEPPFGAEQQFEAEPSALAEIESRLLELGVAVGNKRG